MKAVLKVCVVLAKVVARLFDNLFLRHQRCAILSSIKLIGRARKYDRLELAHCIRKHFVLHHFFNGFHFSTCSKGKKSSCIKKSF